MKNIETYPQTSKVFVSDLIKKMVIYAQTIKEFQELEQKLYGKIIYRPTIEEMELECIMNHFHSDRDGHMETEVIGG